MNLPNNGWYKGVIVFLFLLFFGESLAFAIQTGVNVTTDENYHLSLIRLYSSLPGLVAHNTHASVVFGNITHIPYLYHLLLGKLLHLNLFPISDLIFLRLVNLIFSCGTLIFSWLTFRLVAKDKMTEILALALMMSSLSYVFLSSSVNYDMLLNFLAAGAIYCLFHFFISGGYLPLWGFVVFFLLAALTKTTFLPLGLLLLLAATLILYLKHHKHRLPSLPKKPSLLLLLAIPIIVLFGINLKLYGTNLLHFQHVVPNCEQLLSREDCRKNYFYHRDQELQQNQTNRTLAFHGFSYLLEWKYLIQEKVLGLYVTQKICMNDIGDPPCLQLNKNFFPHITFIHSLAEISWLFSALVIFTVFTALFSLMAKCLRVKIPWRYSPTTPAIILCGIFFFGYLAFLIPVNYRAYDLSGSIHLALNAKYLFLVFPLGAVIFAHFILKFVPQKLRVIVIIPFLLVAVWNVFPTFLSNPSHKYLLHDAPLPPGPCSASFPVCGEIDPKEWHYCSFQEAPPCTSEALSG